VLTKDEVIALQEATVDVPLPDSIVKSILKLVHSTRPNTEAASSYVNEYVGYGAGPRASQCLAKAVRALALLRGKSAVSLDEVKDCALPVLRHRIIPNYNATGEGIGVEQIVEKMMQDL